jgi:hypothetical protein
LKEKVDKNYPQLISVGPLPAGEPRLPFSNLSFRFSFEPSFDPRLVRLHVSTNDPKVLPKLPNGLIAAGVRVGSGVLSKQAQDAPVVWFDGPLHIKLAGLEQLSLIRGHDVGFSLRLGTFVSEDGERVLTLQEIPAEVQPVVEIQFPLREGGKPVMAKFTLKERC